MGWNEFVQLHGIHYVVTTPNYERREVFNHTPLPKLFEHGMAHGIGSSILLDRVAYTKVAEVSGAPFSIYRVDTSVN